jgi:two-component system sensor kinase
VRNIAARLRPRILDDLGLVPAIEWLVRDFRERSGIDAAVVSNTRARSLTPAQATAVFRIVQESLTNIVRHANATSVDVDLDAQREWLTVEIRDNGKGVREDAKTSYDSIGLLGMRERALAVGGELELESVLGRGTVVTLRLPRRKELA